ncbi:MAG TPA: phage portal protein [Geminicoccus sp.]|uniref:phage portal protein n=1 Tax=Geminicoccus sp. TaxID=2024832 RepID=UPI002CE99FE5|nr:phage portal protein [Geminicoccus sp.]HWL70420.1 phage portal protein [Geminicoccus sp.]
MSAKPRIRVQVKGQRITDERARELMAPKPTNVVPFPAAARPRNDFDATKSHRRLKSWQPTGTNLNELLASGGDQLVRRSRDLVRNNGYAANGKEAFTASAVGAGIKPASMHPDKEVRRLLGEAFYRWTDESDADGLTDWYGQQAMVAGALYEAGEMFARFRPRRSEDGLSVPLQVQLLESEMLPWDKRADQPKIRNGIEFSPIGKRSTYHFYAEHPGSGDFGAALERPVSASEVAHVFKPIRPGQIRGVPWLTPAMIMLRFLGDYDDAELARKQAAALFAGFITETDRAFFGDDYESDPDDDSVLAPVTPMTFHKLRPGEDIKFSEPGDVGQQYEAFQYRTLCQICAALGIPYHLVTGDLRQVNYSSIRAGIVDFKRRIEQVQHGVLVFQFCRPTWDRWVPLAMQSVPELLPYLPAYLKDPKPFHAVRWKTPRWEWVDPLKDLKAEQLAVEMRVKARSDVIDEMGEDPEVVDARIKADQDRAEALGIVIESSQVQPDPEPPEAAPAPAQRD